MLASHSPFPSRPPFPLRILLVEDDQPLGLIFRAILERFGHVVAWYQRSPEAWEAWQADLGAYHLLITDDNLPILSGRDLVRRARRSGFTGRILVLGGLVDADTAGELRAEGADLALSKPIGMDELLEAIEQLFPRIIAEPA